MLKYETPFSSSVGNSPARTLTWIDGRISVGTYVGAYQWVNLGYPPGSCCAT